MLDGTREETSSKAGEGGPDTKEVEALAGALNHSAERVQTLCFSLVEFVRSSFFTLAKPINYPAAHKPAASAAPDSNQSRRSAHRSHKCGY
jgi:hypothetical protein